MEKLLQLLIDEFSHKQSTVEYSLLLHRYIIQEDLFLDLLNENQTIEFHKLESFKDNLNDAEHKAFAKFLYDYLK